MPPRGGACGTRRTCGGRRKAVACAHKVVSCQTDLLEIVAARTPSSRLACRLHGGQQQTNQHADDRDHDQQLHKRKAAIFPKIRLPQPSHDCMPHDRLSPHIDGRIISQSPSITLTPPVTAGLPRKLVTRCCRDQSRYSGNPRRNSGGSITFGQFRGRIRMNRPGRKPSRISET